MNEHESAAMWKLYLKSDEGIAIQSTYERLKNSFIDDEEIYLGVVEYVDYETDYVANWNIEKPFVFKRKCFEHEREIRAIVKKLPIINNLLDTSLETIERGINTQVDVDSLIERVFIAPNAPAWFSELVKAVIRRYGYDFDIIHSKLNDRPMF